ncbi:MAG: glycosyltransferase family 39 protein, partial [Nanoarchaeota archaeon]|nr:glycosyltransferase family 39 protein [Nanoarchaeota archaeon]
THSNPPLFFYLTDLAYNILGYTTLASRFWPLICGTMLIGVIFLISRKLFNARVGLFAAFFVTFSSFLVRMTFSEQSLVVFFLSFLGVYLGMLYLDSKSANWLIASGVIFGLALLTKYNAPFFILSFLIFSSYYLKLEGVELNKKTLKPFGIFVLVLVIAFIPVIAFNYFIYQEKGIVDVYFSRVVHVEKAQQLYVSLAGQGNSFFGNFLNLGNYGNYNLVYHVDLIIFLLGLLGLGLWFKGNKRIPLAFFFLFLVIPFLLQSAGAPLAKHFAFMFVLFSIPAGYALNAIFDKYLLNRKTLKIIILIIISVLMIINLGNSYSTPSHYASKSATSELKDYINQDVKDNELVVFDDRIYNARNFWLATDKPFLTMAQFPQFYEFSKNSTSPKLMTKVHFIECIIDDCGWGWIASNQELNQSSEKLFREMEISGAASVTDNLIEKNYHGNEITGTYEEREIYRVYSLNVPLTAGLVEQTKMLQNFYFAPYLYKNMNDYIYNYKTSGIGNLINSLALFEIYLAMFLVFLVVFLVLILF